MLRVGHGGAGALARANTLESFDAALSHGIDMIEFDVRARQGRLVLAHYPVDPRRRPCLRLEEALEHLSRPAFHGIRFNVDVKQTGIEAPLLYALERFGLTDSALFSSQPAVVLDRLRALDVIAWVREPAAIHITVSRDAQQLLPLLERIQPGP